MKFVCSSNADNGTHSKYYNKSGIGVLFALPPNLNLVTRHNVKMNNIKIQSHCAHNKEAFLMSGQQKSSVTFTTFQVCWNQNHTPPVNFHKIVKVPFNIFAHTHTPLPPPPVYISHVTVGITVRHSEVMYVNSSIKQIKFFPMCSAHCYNAKIITNAKTSVLKIYWCSCCSYNGINNWLYYK